MKVVANRYTLKILVLGSKPPMSQWSKYEHLRWSGIDPMTWIWNERLVNKLSDEDLLNVYYDIKEAWNTED